MPRAELASAQGEARTCSDLAETLLCDGALKFHIGGVIRVEEIVPDG